MDATQDRSNRLSVTRSGGQLITDYWDNLFQAREQGKQIVWYNGGALNPIFQAAGRAWCPGEAFAARLAAQRRRRDQRLPGAGGPAAVAGLLRQQLRGLQHRAAVGDRKRTRLNSR